jgi:hypothetical protein
MAAHPEAHFSKAVWEQIKAAQLAVDEHFWPKMHAMTVGMLDAHRGGIVAAMAFGDPSRPPRPPRVSLPETLFALLVDYAIELFNCEFDHYAPEQIATWTPGLSDRIEQRVMGHVALLEEQSFRSLSIHATRQEMQMAIRKGLTEHCKTLPAAMRPVPEAQRLIEAPPKLAASPAPSPLRQPRLSSAIESHGAARKMERFIKENGLTQEEFARSILTTGRTLRSFRKKGTIGHDLFEKIANKMGTTKAELMKDNG